MRALDPPETSVRPAVLPGAGWAVRTALDATLLFLLVTHDPATARWSWVVLVAVRALTAAATYVTGPASATVLGVDGVLVAAVALAHPSTSVALLLPWVVVTVAAAITGLRSRLALTSGVAVLLATTAVGAPAPTDAALVAGLVSASLLAWIVGEQTATLRAGTNSVLTWLRGRSSRMLDATSEALVVTDATGRVVQGNAAAAELGDVPVNDLPGTHCAGMRLNLGLAPLDCTAGCALLGRTDTDDVEVWQGVEGGERRHLLARVSPVLDARGGVVEVMHAFRDISGIRRSQEGETLFLAAASHELKTPLTVIRGFAGLLRDTEVDPEQQRRMLDTIIARSGELSEIVGRLLLTGQVGSGRLELSLSSVDVTAVVTDRSEAIRETVSSHEVVVRSSDTVPALADDQAVATVVDHLLENAVKYSPDGGLVEVRVDHTPAAVSIAVRDEGIGMSPTDGLRCFDRFWQGDVGERRRFGGTGVGLYLVRQLVEGMGGTVTVESVIDEGTTFVVLLPRADDRDVPLDLDRHSVRDIRPGMVDAVMDHVGVRRSG